jgi:hypothetical protein
MEKEFPQIYKEIKCDSFDEIFFLDWIFELMEMGYVRTVRRAETFQLSSPCNHHYYKPLKTKQRSEVQTLLNKHVYTPEFYLEWEEKAKDIFFQYLDEAKKITLPIIAQFDMIDKVYFSYFEVKPKFDQQNMERLFRINQKWIWQVTHRFINLVKVHDLFPKTFTPMAFLYTRTGKDKKINWVPISLTEYLKLF